MSNLSLLRARRFLPLFLTQGFGAINDNLFKNALVILALLRLAHTGPIIVALAGGVFILPYALFSATAGQLADSREKSRLILYVKFWELGLALLATAGFLGDSFVLLMAVLFGLGVQATFFSPLKYGILPDHLAEPDLVAGNGLIEAGTFIGILAGTLAGGALILFPAGPLIVSGAFILIALAGIAAAYNIPAAAAAAPNLRLGRNIPRETAALIRIAAANPPVWFAILGISWFWAIGATLLAEFPTVAHDSLHADGHVVTLMLAVFAIGVGIGSLACAAILRGRISLRPVAYAGIGVSIFTVDFAVTAMRAHHLQNPAAMLSSLQGWHLMLDLLLLATCGGIYSVPLYVILQERADRASRSRMIAANNIMNAIASVIAAGLTAAVYAIGLPGTGTLILIAIANLAVSAWIFRKQALLF